MPRRCKVDKNSNLKKRTNTRRGSKKLGAKTPNHHCGEEKVFV